MSGTIAKERKGARMSQIAEQVFAEMLRAAKERGIDLTATRNAFLLGKKSPRFTQPWLLYGYRQLATALLKGGYLAWVGNTDVFVLDCGCGLVFGFDSDGSPRLVE